MADVTTLWKPFITRQSSQEAEVYESQQLTKSENQVIYSRINSKHFKLTEKLLDMHRLTWLKGETTPKQKKQN